MNARGLTAVELTVWAAVVAVLAGMFLTFLQTGEKVWARTDSQLTNVDIAQRAMDRMREDLQNARQGATLDCTIPDGIQMQLRTTDGTIGDTIRYTCNSCDSATPGTLERAVNGGVPQVVASGLSALTPTCGFGGIVTLQLTTQVTPPHLPTTPRTIQSQVRVRNS